MDPKKHPETQKTSEVALHPSSKRSGSPGEQEHEAKLCVEGPGSSRRSDAGPLREGLAGWQAPPQCRSIVRALHHHKVGRTAWSAVQQNLQQSFLNSLASYRIFQKVAPFDRRATSMAWHPTHPSTLAVGSKGGDIMLWNFGIKDKPYFIKGIGAGGSITGLKFNPLNTNQFFISSMEGTTRLQDFRGNILQVYTNYGTCNLWFCSLDVSAKRRVVVTGDNVGHVVLLNMDGRELWNLRLHKKKVTHVALNPYCDWFLATASVDQTVKVWDLRKVRGNYSFVSSLRHLHPVNAVHFNTDGVRLLTTDQKSEIRVYSDFQWGRPPRLIPHPHRHFQHLTPIKAAWHPRYNLIVVGRYPDPNFRSGTPHELRTIDVFDGSSGKLMQQLYNPELPGICSLNEFNPMGDTLASLMGYRVLIWSQQETSV